MKAAVYRVKKDPPELEIVDLPYPEPGKGEVTVRIKYIGVNPIDYWISSGRYAIKSPNNIVGSEAYGIVDSVGEGVDDLYPGDEVSVYPWIFCGECRYCIKGLQNLCVKGGIVGGVLDGTYAEYIKLPASNVAKIVGDAPREYYSVIGVSVLTALHAVNVAEVSQGENVLVYGASGNVGMFLLQYSKLRGANVFGVSRWSWILDYGADVRLKVDEIESYVSDTGIEFDVIFNPIGGSIFGKSLHFLSRKGRLVTFGGLTSMSSEINIAPLYRRELIIKGSTGGTKEEFLECIRDIGFGDVKPYIWKIFSLEEAGKALNSLFSKERTGKILIKV